MKAVLHLPSITRPARLIPQIKYSPHTHIVCLFVSLSFPHILYTHRLLVVSERNISTHMDVGVHFHQPRIIRQFSRSTIDISNFFSRTTSINHSYTSNNQKYRHEDPHNTPRLNDPPYLPPSFFRLFPSLTGGDLDDVSRTLNFSRNIYVSQDSQKSPN